MEMLIDLVAAAFSYIKTLEDVDVLDELEKETAGFSKHSVIWQIRTEILSPDFVVIPITFHLLLNIDFPLSFPKIYLAPDIYPTFKWLPHIDDKRLICTFDSEKSRPNPDLPGEVIYFSLSRAKHILTNGLAGRNFEDYDTEFVAYWEQRFNDTEKLSKSLLYLNQKTPTGDLEFKIITFKYSLQGYEMLLHQNDKKADDFKNYLKDIYLSYTESDVLYLDNYTINSVPPFAVTYGELIETLRSMGGDLLKNFKRYLNSAESPAILLFRHVAGSEEYLLGYRIHLPNFNNRNRYRKLSNYQMLKEHGWSSHVERLSPKLFSLDRLQKRASGISAYDQHKFLLAGLGSIGSHLFSFLETFDNPEFSVIDHDDLRIENIGRHLLGFSYTNKPKVTAMKEYYLNRNPLNQIQTRNASIVSILAKEPNFLNDADYIFICIGKFNIESYIVDALRKRLIHKPVFFLWVEPFLAAGHCIFYHPADVNKEYFDEHGLFKHNVISATEYLNEKTNLSLSEAGCQTSYIPYSGLNVQLFLSRINFRIHNIIQNKSQASQSFSWVGNLAAVREKTIALSEESQSWSVNDLIEH